MGLKIPDLNDEWLYAVVVLERDTACKEHCVCRLQTKSPWPELGSFYSRTMDRELLCFRVISCCSFKSSYVWSMSKLCLSITTYDIKIVSQRNVMRLLFLCGKILQRVREHALMECQWWLPWEQICPAKVILWLWTITAEMLVAGLVLHDNFVASPPHSELFISGHLIIIDVRSNLGMLLNDAIDILNIVN